MTKGGQPAPDVIVQTRVSGLAGTNRFIGTRTRSDGSYAIGLPANLTLSRVCAFDVNTVCPATGSGSGTGANYAFQDNVVMGAAGTSTTQNLAY